MEVGKIVQGEARLTTHTPWFPCELKLLAGGSAQCTTTKIYLPPHGWRARGVVVYSHERWMIGEVLIHDGKEYRFGGYASDGYVKLFTMAWGDARLSVPPDQCNRVT